MQLVNQSIGHIKTTEQPLNEIELAARECYQSKPQISHLANKQEEFIRNLIKKGHETPLEFATTAFRITTDRGVLAELTRHRLASFCVESTRYVKYKELRYILPVGMSNTSATAWMEMLKQTEQWYLNLRAEGASPQVARDILPLCTAVNLRMSANWREWRHILRLRTASGAHPKMRSLMEYVRTWFKLNYPVIVEDIEAND